MPGGRGSRTRGTLVWDAARSRFFPETCGLFPPPSDCGGEVDEWAECRRREWLEHRGKPDQGGHRSSGGIGSGLRTRSRFLVWMVFGSGNVPVLALQFNGICKVPPDISEYGHYLILQFRLRVMHLYDRRYFFSFYVCHMSNAESQT